MKRLFALFALACLLLPALVACDTLLVEIEEGMPTVVAGPRDGEPAGWYEIYFTDPSCPPEEERRGGVDEIIAQDMLGAQESVDIAAFDLDSVAMVDALINLEDREIAVRVVTDNDNEELTSVRRLRRSGISVVTDDRSALMHNKFVVIDGRYVWTGSLNYTTNGAYCNNNNAVRIDSAELAANYVAEMDEMYYDRSFGPRSANNTLRANIRINGVLVENYFAPELKVAPIIVEAIERADEEILFMAFSFTQEEIGEAMLEQAENGVLVRGVFETTGSETAFSYYPPMHDAFNVGVRQDGNPRIMHHKVIIIDRETVILGSFNFSASANDSNDENVLIVHDEEFAGYFAEEFELVWEEAAD